MDKSGLASPVQQFVQHVSTSQSQDATTVQEVTRYAAMMQPLTLEDTLLHYSSNPLLLDLRDQSVFPAEDNIPHHIGDSINILHLEVQMPPPPLPRRARCTWLT